MFFLVKFILTSFLYILFALLIGIWFHPDDTANQKYIVCMAYCGMVLARQMSFEEDVKTH